MNARSGAEEIPAASGRSAGQAGGAQGVPPDVPRQRGDGLPAPGTPDAAEPRPSGAPFTPVPAAAVAAVPRAAAGAAGPDPLEQHDPARAADAATTENLLRCWLRETATDPAAPSGDRPGELLLRLEASGVTLRVPVRHWSATGWHRFGPPGFEGAGSGAAPVDAVTLAALLAREAGYRASRADRAERAAGLPGAASAPGRPAGGARVEGADLVGRVADSVRHTAVFLTERRAAPVPPGETSPFLDAEQSLLLGHPLHPAPKSRGGLTEGESRAYAPELRGAFPLHWFAADRSVLAADSAWTERGRTVTAERLAAVLAGGALDLPDGLVPLPLHPWQAEEVRRRPAVAELLDKGLLHDLGPAGTPWRPTSSVRTVHQPGTPAMLKLSLALRITNSRRENLRKELHRGVEVHRLLRTGLADEWRAAFPEAPGFDIVRDPAWLGVDGPDGAPVAGLDTVIRHNPFGPDDRAVCLAALTSPRTWPDGPPERLTSPLARIVSRLARQTGRPPAAVSAEWLLRYLSVVVRPVLWLDAVAGVALEAHQQNTLVLLDRHGWPQGGRYRDNQGYYFRTSHRDALQRRLPAVGEASDSFVADPVTDERFAYYLGVNNILGLVGAFGSTGLADEELLLAAVRRFLAGQTAAGGPDTPGSPLPALLLDSPTLRCKANLLTRLHGLDELVGPVETQSVYVTVANPLAPR